MAIRFLTPNPYLLLSTFKKAIDDKHDVTWAYDPSGDFTHTPQQWRYKGWLSPYITPGCLTMNFVGRADETTTKVVYGVYHGRFIEALLMHCDTLFSSAESTAMPTRGDTIKAA